MASTWVQILVIMENMQLFQPKAVRVEALNEDKTHYSLLV